MSDSTPKPPANSARPADEEPRWRLPWWAILSVLFHALVLAWVVSLPAPAQNAAQADGHEALSNAAPERLKEVAEQINATQADEVRAKVDELLSIEHELAEVSDEKKQIFADLAKDLAAGAPQKADDAETTAADAQAEAETAEMEAAEDTTDWKKAQEGADAAQTPEERTATGADAALAMSKAKAAQARAKAAQTKAAEAQTRALQQTGLSDAAFADAKAKQADANRLQDEANQKQDTATGATNEVATLQRQVERTRETAGSARRAAGSAQARLDAHQTALTRVQADRDKQKAAADSAEAAVAEAKTQAQAATDEKGKAAAADAEKRATQATDKARAAQTAAESRMAKETAEIEKGKVAVLTAAQKATAAEAEAVKPAADLAAAPAAVVSAQADALRSQQKAREAQTQAKTALTSAQTAANATASTGATTPVPTDSSALPPASATVPAPDLDNKSFGDLYAAAVEAEKDIAAKYDDIRTEETATRQQIPLEEARKLVQDVQPTRPALDPTLTGANVDTADALAEHNAAMEKALEQINSMLAHARGMSSQTRNSPNGVETSGVNLTSVADVKAEASEVNELGRLGTEGQASDIAVDLTDMMKQIASGTVNGTAPTMETGATSGQGTGTVTTAGTTAPEGVGLPGGSGMPGSAKSGPPSGYGLAMTPGSVRDSLAGRRIHAEGNGGGSKWMFVDSWYVVGPFPNPQRRNIDTKFPPEGVVDLDAVYPGKDGRQLHWKFIQANQAAIHPPDEQEYAIYYAYTTLWFDQESDVWIAVGSDDFSKLWINDMPVWASGLLQKNWKPNEGYRKVHFKQGINRVLYRVENGQHACIYSLMLRTDGSGG